MTERVKRALAFLRARDYRAGRRTEVPRAQELAAIRAMAPSSEREAALFVFAAEAEEPRLYQEELFGFHRTCVNPTGGGGRFGNVIPDYEGILREGLGGIERRIRERYPKTDEQGRRFYDAVLTIYQALFALCDRYRDAAERAGHTRLYAALTQVPRHGARDYYEALVMLKLLHFFLRLINTVHVPFGRYDQYMKPYFDRSLAAGATYEALKELTALFFISTNLDTDLYIGIQQGDNGQSMVLGGCDREGNPVFNELSELCLQVSEELDLIDPKINLRVDGKTPLALYERGTRLTRRGLGFPQYCNDDIAIPFLSSMGYEIADARNYALAACWEFIIPACGADSDNVDTVNFPLAMEKATARLADCPDAGAFMEVVRQELVAECERRMKKHNGRHDANFAPLLSSLVTPCIERGREIREGGAGYYNFGFHGAGISTAADALAAICLRVYEERCISPATLLAALAADFEGYGEVRELLLSAPKMGDNEDYVDDMATFLMDVATETVNGRPNGHGGICRMGTGSAMAYVLEGVKVGATADGRRAGEAFACSFSPSPLATGRGPLSAIQSFTKYDLRKICNGGPFTIEIHDTVFRNEEGERKVAQLVKSFIDLGGHQIQINAVNRDRLLRARAHPEDDPHLIVRVWGWSGYFNELDTVYQDHIIARTEFQV